MDGKDSVSNKVVITVEFDPVKINTTGFGLIMHVLRLINGVVKVDCIFITPSMENLYWENVTFTMICKALSCNHAHNAPKSEFDAENKADINEAQARQSQLLLIKVVRRMSGLDLISAKRWVEEYLSKP